MMCSLEAKKEGKNAPGAGFQAGSWSWFIGDWSYTIQPMPLIVFVNRRAGGNLGDALSSPGLYFRSPFRGAIFREVHLGQWGSGTIGKQISRLLRDRARLIIVGGGGLLGNPFFTADLEFWSGTASAPKVLWGTGHNSHDVMQVAGADPKDLDYGQVCNFDAIGLRDWGSGYTWVPCASCMHPALHKETSEGPAILFAMHRDVRSERSRIEALQARVPGPSEVVFNDTTAEEFIGRIRTARAVVTNSYHAAYWAALLRKRVVVIGGGTKVRLFKHKVALAGWEDWPEKLDEAPVHEHALEECCEANVDFCRRIVAAFVGDGAAGGRGRKYQRDPVRERAEDFQVGRQLAPAILRNRVPKVVHFVFGLAEDFGGRPFNVLHHNAVLSVAARARPEGILFHHCYEPDNEWYNRVRHLVTPHRIDLSRYLRGRAVQNRAHQNDILRLELLRETGGIYLDMDTVTVRPFDTLLNKDFTIGIQGRKHVYGLGNSVMLSARGDAFVTQWLEHYGQSEETAWDRFAVELPYLMWRSGKWEINVEPYDRFHWPLFDGSLAMMFEKNCQFPNAICHHLWASCSYEKYFSAEAPAVVLPRLKNGRSTYSRLVRDLL